ncbi:glycoside hydrolase family 3 N-terminal domain-containing protein [Lacticaseibacillus daqingensis]|uniref:glycoside hydrolase family 3 N-terminal domain-containing protein n=1 Tax=Lacticaseibacillus daqingensis TaxID=2486014 RepID=UPI000F77C9DD|nr:glycoside hydrolase family 3 N-terminal domain-containing protein [Lacticaseibacillus daqingensis]
MKKISKAAISLLGCVGLLLGSGGLNVTTVHAAESTTPSSAPTDAQIKTYISQMTLAEKVGQMFVSRTPQDNDQVRSDVAKYNLGGLIVYGADFESVDTAQEFKDKLQSFQDAANLPLFVGVDQEGGTVSRLSNNPIVSNYRDFPSPQELYAQGGIDADVKEATEVAKILRDLGVNWNFAPDADCTTDTSAFIFKRTLGQDYQTTADYISKVVPAWQTSVAATLKHFPGYGAAVDTHTDFSVVQRTKEQFENEDLLPFRAGIKAGVDSIMIAHIVMEAVDPDFPASLSPKVINGVLRDELGYDGVVITDGLGMGAITTFAKNHDNAPVDVLAVEAGNDGIMNNDYATAIPQIVDAVKAGSIQESEIDTHVFRMLSLKRKLGLLTTDNIKVNQIAVNDVTYDEAAKTATVTATVPNSDALQLLGEPIYAKDATGKVVAQTLVGGEGAVKLELPMTDAAQTLTLTTGTKGVIDQTVTIKALTKTDATQESGAAGASSSSQGQESATSQSSSNPSSSASSRASSTTTPKKTGTKGHLPQTGNAKFAAMTSIGLLAVAMIAVLGIVTYKKRHA